MNTEIETVALNDAALETVNGGFVQFLFSTGMTHVFSGISQAFGGNKIDGRAGFLIKGGIEIAKKIAS